MKAKIEKEIELSGQHFFLVSANGKHVKALPYDPRQPDENPYSEKSKLAEAMALVKNIEQGKLPAIETIYETPEEKTEQPIPTREEVEQTETL